MNILVGILHHGDDIGPGLPEDVSFKVYIPLLDRVR